MGDEKKGVDWNFVLKVGGLALLAGGAGYMLGQASEVSSEARFWAERKDRLRVREDELSDEDLDALDDGYRPYEGE